MKIRRSVHIRLVIAIISNSGKSMRHLVLAVLALLAVPNAFAQSQMQFSAFPPDPLMNEMMGDHAWRIYASGPVDMDADKRLEAILETKKVPEYSRIYLHSEGGSLTGGIKLGRMIRKHMLHTNIGQLDRTAKGRVSASKGECYSACALAYLGGRFRFLMSGSAYGVHRWTRRQHTMLTSHR